MPGRPSLRGPLLLFGVASFAVAALSIVDMLLPRPYDGVVLEADAPGTLRVREVVAGSGADRAGLRAGDRIVGIDRQVLASTAQAAQLLARRAIGEVVPYLVRRPGGVEEVPIELGRRMVANASYLFACLLGFAFFAVGLFVLRKQRERRAAQVFFLLCTLFLLFLVCRLRPASYSWVDEVALDTGMVAILFLPAAFLHFFLIFPVPVALRPRGGEPDFGPRRRRWLATLAAIYLIPAAVAQFTVWTARGELRLISGAPQASWWVLAAYVIAGLLILGSGLRRLPEARERRGVGLLLVGTLAGLVPFLAVAFLRPHWLHKDPWAFAALLPVALVPLTFAVAIVRFGLLDVRVLLRRSLVYTGVTALVTVVYAAVLALFNTLLARGGGFAATVYFPLVFALAVVFLFEPLRRRTQEWVDRFVLAERARLQAELRELARAVAERVDLEAVVRDLVERLPRLLGLHFAALYLERDGRCLRAAGPQNLPEELSSLQLLTPALARLDRWVAWRDLEELLPVSAEAKALAEVMDGAGVEWLGELASSRRRLGTLLLSAASGQLTLEAGELELLDSLRRQAAIALETRLLLEERTRQAELERELEIAARVQAEVLPPALHLATGWQVAGRCRAAKQVCGDFFAELPGPHDGSRAVVFGDVAGKSVAGAMVMMAAHEALQTLALTHRDPEQLLHLANQRLYRLGSKKGFVAAGYLAASADGAGLDYLLAGQPPLLLRAGDGRVRELPVAGYRLPLGALADGAYRRLHTPVAAGELVLAYSDGVVEAQSPGGEIFGGERLAKVLGEAPAEPEAAIGHLLAAIERFVDGGEPYDDITLVALARGRELRP